MQSKFDLRAYLSTYAYVQATYNDNTEWVVRCRCDRERGSARFHLYINVDKGVGQCKRCGALCTDAMDLVRLVEDCSLAEAAARVLEGSLAVSERLSQVERMLASSVEEPEGSPVMEVRLPAGFQPCASLPSLPRYLLQRGVSREECERYYIGVCRVGYFRNRVIVPVPDREGNLASFVARWMGDPPEGVQKVLYPKGSRTGRVLFNHDVAATHKHVIVCEGVFDAIRAGPSAVALFGKHASSQQVAHLVELGMHRRITIMLDRDAATDADWLAVELSAVCPRVYVARVPRHRHDPAECTRAELARAAVRARRAGGAVAGRRVRLGALVDRLIT